ncbi:MAG: DUF5107 domain-containing protein [Clostridia bacterium]|nr:DUF5107 domain-containing protein [Clostridia bacterium]
MTSLYKSKLDVKSADIGPESSLPPLFTVNTRDPDMPSDLPEEDGLYLKYEFLKSIFPYRFQDNYNREYTGVQPESIVLENEFLRAEFVPSLGGKLWSLFDKERGRELLFKNPVVRPAYLATRSAWCSGGVEWNCGVHGHTPFTCSPIFAARLSLDDGTPVLRMYEFERIRGVVYQMDFFLPEGSRLLYARMRVVNPALHATAMYWWSNIAVPHVDGARVVVPAVGAYTPLNGVMTTVPVPTIKLSDVVQRLPEDNRFRRKMEAAGGDIDITYPDNNPVSVDYFFRTDKTRRMYTCQLSKEGYGLFQASTSRLVGRKIFVWGQGPGGRKWQEYLSGEGCDGKYCEIQCGLAHTQSEHIPMPPRTAWEWLEIYGAMNADGKKVHSDWDTARGEVESRIDSLISAEALEQLLKDTHDMALAPAEELISTGSGWGALENLRREKAGTRQMCPQLDFGKTGDAQAAYIDLLEKGSMGAHPKDTAPAAWIKQKEWTLALEEAVQGPDADNWYTLLQLGCLYLSVPDLLRAEIYIDRSLKAEKTAWGLYALAELKRVRGDTEGCALTMLEAAKLAPDDASLAKMTARHLQSAKLFEKQKEYIEGCADAIRDLPRMKLYYAFALSEAGEAEKALAILENGGRYLEIPDIQEGEISLSELWYNIQEKLAAKAGKPFDRAGAKPPYELDFRMFAE